MFFLHYDPKINWVEVEKSVVSFQYFFGMGLYPRALCKISFQRLQQDSNLRLVGNGPEWHGYYLQQRYISVAAHLVNPRRCAHLVSYFRIHIFMKVGRSVSKNYGLTLCQHSQKLKAYWTQTLLYISWGVRSDSCYNLSITTTKVHTSVKSLFCNIALQARSSSHD